MKSDPSAEAVEAEFDAVAWRFLQSQYAGGRFAGWPIDRRLDAYLRHHELAYIADDGTASVSLLERVMANISLARKGRIQAATRSADP